MAYLTGNFFDLTTNFTKSCNIISIRVMAPCGNKILFRIDKSLTIADMFCFYCMRQCVAIECIEMSYKNQILHPNDTPILLDMKNDSIIKATLMTRH